MTFDEYMLIERPTYRSTDDGMADRHLRRCWETARYSERDDCAALLEKHATQAESDCCGNALVLMALEIRERSNVF